MSVDSLHAHLQTCATTVARTWSITRRDGLVLGFTDHDLDLEFDGIDFRAETGLTAKAIHQTSGLSVDNSEAMGALTDDRIKVEDVNAGLFDDAIVRSWLVNWQNTEDRKLLFKGTLGEIRRSGHAFDVELRGLTEALNQPQGRVFQKPCSAVLGDGACAFDLDSPGYFTELPLETIEDRQILRFQSLAGFEEGWFTRGRLLIKSGAAKSIVGWIKSDRIEGTTRIIELWEPVRGHLQPGDSLRLEAGCDKRAQTCQAKFDNIVNFQGFPFIPGEDWLMAVPSNSGNNDGGALF